MSKPNKVRGHTSSISSNNKSLGGMSPIYDVIVVGAGPAGATAALVLARQGLKVILIERGEYPGSKNMFGGALFGRVLTDLIPEYWRDAPVERYIGRKIISILTNDSAVSLDIQSAVFKQPPYNGFVVQRSQFDRWYAQEAVKAGALLLTRTTVRDVVWENNQVVGVLVDRSPGEIRAKVVIAADGVVSLLAQKAGLRSVGKPEQYSLGVKEVIQLPPGALEGRFNLNGDEGVSNEYLGLMGDGLHGGAFLYTNKESVSIGVVAQAHSLKARRATIYEALDQFKSHPVIRPLLAGGRVLEYSAHLIPEAGYKMLPTLSTGGMLVAGDAAALVLMGGVFLEGVNLAIASGRIAAETVAGAFAAGRFDASTLASYNRLLKESFVLKDLKRFQTALPLLMNKRLYEVYPSFIIRTLEKWFMVDGQGHQKLAGVVKEMLDEDTGLWQLTKDGYQAGRGLVW